LGGEAGYLGRALARGFVWPCGWDWGLMLQGGWVQHSAAWVRYSDDFAHAFARRFADFLPLQTYPIRVGTHYNSAFALTLALDWARANDGALEMLIEARARDWYLGDRGCQAWEPGGDEFLSGALCEALLMSRVLGADFAPWFDAFLPDCAEGQPATLFTPATVSDRSDGKIAHLDGLSLSRAWCWRQIAAALPGGHPVCPVALAAADEHLAAALPHVAGDYMGEHWLASFALLALQA